MTKREVEIQARLLRHKANGCISALSKWRDSYNEEERPVALAALKTRFHQLEAEAQGLDELVENWDEFGPFFEVREPSK